MRREHPAGGNDKRTERTASRLVVRCAGYEVRCQGCRADWVMVWRRPSRRAKAPSMFSTPWRPRRGLTARPVRSKTRMCFLAVKSASGAGAACARSYEFYSLSPASRAFAFGAVSNDAHRVSLLPGAPRVPQSTACAQRSDSRPRCVKSPRASSSLESARSTDGFSCSGLPSASAWPPRRSAAPI